LVVMEQVLWEVKKGCGRSSPRSTRSSILFFLYSEEVSIFIGICPLAQTLLVPET